MSGIPIIGESKDTTTIQCSTCQLYITVNIPKFEIINTQTVSMIMWSKGNKPIVCKCGQAYAGVIAQFDPRAIGSAYAPVPSQSGIEVVKSLIQ